MLFTVLIAAFPAALSTVAPPPPSVQPRPIGVGPGYVLPAAPPAVLEGHPVGRLRCGRAASRRFGVHVELFARRQVVIVPAGIGVARPFSRRLGRIAPQGCSYRLRTLEPTGVVEVGPGTRLAVRDLFALWGQPLARTRLAGFESRTPVLAYLGGKRWQGDPGSIPLTRHAQIVLEIDGYVPPHPAYLFQKGL